MLTYTLSCIKVVTTKLNITKFSKVILAAIVLGLYFIFCSGLYELSPTHNKIKIQLEIRNISICKRSKFYFIYQLKGKSCD